MHHWCKFWKKWGGQFYAFLQLCLNTEHWTLFTANMTRKELSFFDSGLEFGLSKAIHKDAERLIDFLDEWEATEGNKDCPNRSQVNWVWSKMEVHQQANTFDCGIGVEQFLDFWQGLPEFPFSTRIYQWTFLWIQMGTIWSPHSLTFVLANITGSLSTTFR